MAQQLNYEKEIIEIRIDIKQLLDNLGKRDDDFCLFKSNNFNNQLYIKHKQIHKELLLEWNEITNDLDNLLTDLDNNNTIHVNNYCNNNNKLQINSNNEIFHKIE
eukprot:227537_1